MYFIAQGLDKPDAHALRAATRPAHLAYLQSLGDTVVLGGPFLDAEGNAVGSMVLYRADDLARVEAMASADPYVTAGVFASVEVRPWRWVVNPPAGG